jgi:SSS family solute:Na+ symporter
MTIADYLIIVIFFIGLLAVGYGLGKKISSSKDLFIAGKNSSWWISGLSTYMTLFSAGTFVVWGGVAYRSGLVAAVVGMMLGIGSLAVGLWISGKWARMNINSPAEYLTLRFGKGTLKFYSSVLIVGRALVTAVALYSIAIMVVALMPLPAGSMFVDPATGHLSVIYAVLVMGLITFIYTAMGGYLAVLMTDVVQFAVLFAMIIILVPLSLKNVGGISTFIASAPDGYFRLFSKEYSGLWMILWCLLNFFMIAGDWSFVQRYISVPNAKEAKKSSYLVGALYLLTPIIWYLPAMAYRIVDPGANPEQAYMLMSQRVLGPGLLGFMIAAMMSATLSMVSGTLNVFANVFTYDIYASGRSDISDRQKIKVGKNFTWIYGLLITVLAALIPYLGGAEKVVVTILTVVIQPIFIPSIWGLYSKKITQNDVLASMSVTYIIAILVKFRLIFGAAASAHPQMADAIVGCLVPLLILTILEFARRKSPVVDGYLIVKQRIKAASEVETAKVETASENTYSKMAIRIMMFTFIAIGIISLALSFFFKGNRHLLVIVGVIMTIFPSIILFVQYLCPKNNLLIKQCHRKSSQSSALE